MAREVIDASQLAITRILHKMDEADKEFCESVKQAGMNYFVEFTREYFGEFMKPVDTPDEEEQILEPTPLTGEIDRIGLPRKKIPKTVVVMGVEFTKTEVQTCIRLSNQHLE